MKRLLFSALFALAALSGLGQDWPADTLLPRATYIGGIEFADIDGDGDQDGVALTNSGGLGWYPNLGEGVFGHRNTVDPDLMDIHEVKVGDINGDGSPDLVAQLTWYVLTYQNTGNGTFSNPDTVANVYSWNTFMKLEDLDGDNDLDILMSVDFPQEMVWMENTGGDFAPPQFIFEVEYFSNRAVDVIDIDEDSDQDIVFIHHDTLIVLRNDGSQIYSPEPLVTEFISRHRSFGDIDGDDDLDLVVMFDTDTLVVHENSGGGVFDQEPEFVQLESTNDILRFFALIDLNLDGDLDAAFTDSQPDESMWYVENDGGVFQPQSLTLMHSDCDYIHALDTVDLSGDGAEDLVVITDESAIWMENQADWSFGDPTVVTEFNFFPLGFLIDDVDGDALSDILLNQHNREPVWYKGDENFELGMRNSADGQECQYSNITSIDFADLNGDGNKDIVELHRFTSVDTGLFWRESLGNGEFASEVELLGDMFETGIVMAIDIDNDDDMDLLASNRSANELFGSDGSAQIFLLENDGSGNFTTSLIVEDLAGTVRDFAPLDFDNDGDLDLVLAGNFLLGSTDLVLVTNNGLNDFGEISPINNSNTGLRKLSVTDVNEDGILDVVAHAHGNVGLVWHEGNTTGDYWTRHVIDPSYGMTSLDVADFDQDGDDDVVSLIFTGPPRINWYRNEGGGTFEIQSTVYDDFGIASERRLTAKYDLDDDGDKDVCAFVRNGTYVGDALIWFENTLNEGCMDPTACNYDESVIIDDGSCCYTDCGCTDPLANNYDPNASCDNGSCAYDIVGRVFYDENSNGELDSTEIGLAFQQLTIQPSGSMGITNDSGYFHIIGNSEPNFTIWLEADSAFPYYTTTHPLAVNSANFNSEGGYLFGLTDQFPLIDIGSYITPVTNGFLCNDWQTYQITIQNSGNEYLDIVAQCDFDSLFQGYQEVDPIDSVIGNSLFWSFDSIAPSGQVSVNVQLLTPTVDFISDSLNIELFVSGVADSVQTAAGYSILIQEITCAYDPNDKQVTPAGYDDAHYVFNDTLRYKIRFQNTGNAMATDVVIRDTMDADLDLSTFELLNNSHDVIVSVNAETRLVEFIHNNIMLPDSFADEPNSHGFVIYQIAPLDSLEDGAIIENTAGIFFDNNPPIVTNTTWNTIYSCSDASITANSPVLTANTEMAEYQWLDCNANLSAIVGQTDQILTVVENGSYAVEITRYECLDTSECVLINDVSILENNFGTSVQLFPNPTTGNISIKLGKSLPEIEVSVINELGQKVHNSRLQNSQRFDLEIPGESGVYFVELMTADKRAIVRVVKEE